MKKASLLAVLLVLTAMSFTALTIMPGNVRATTLYVGGGGPGNYTTIQAAINAASPGDVVYVYSGTYSENVIVSKSLSLIGEDAQTAIIDAGSSDSAVTVTFDWVNITGFTLTNSGS
ncbi:MAG: cell surface protein, partial [Thermoplasmata archaeon]